MLKLLPRYADVRVVRTGNGETLDWMISASDTTGAVRTGIKLHTDAVSGRISKCGILEEDTVLSYLTFISPVLRELRLGLIDFLGQKYTCEYTIASPGRMKIIVTNADTGESMDVHVPDYSI